MAIDESTAQTLGHSVVIERKYEVEISHWLPNVPFEHKCWNMHGHSMVVDLYLHGITDSDSGWFVEFAEVDKHLGSAVKELDHHCLNDFHDNPTAENMALWILDGCLQKLRILQKHPTFGWVQRTRKIGVRLSETRKSAVYVESTWTADA